MLFVDVNEIKSILEIPIGDKSEDRNLNFYAEWATGIIQEVLNRDIEYKSRTSYLRGTGTQKLLLRCRPVFTNPLPQVFVDETGYFGSTSGAFSASNSQLVYGQDFCLEIDQDDGSSRSGILYRLNAYWPMQQVRQRGMLSPFLQEDMGSIKIVYTAGYTLDTLPSNFRVAANMLVAKLRYLFPLGVQLTSESFEDRSISVSVSEKEGLMSMVRPLLLPFRNFKW